MYHQIDHYIIEQISKQISASFGKPVLRTSRLNKVGHKQKIKTAKDVFDHYVDNLQDKKRARFNGVIR